MLPRKGFVGDARMEGLTNREIAKSLKVSLQAIKTHVKRIFTKVGVHDRAQAVVAAYEARLVAPTA
jgi:DNA-binding NarL/FixJ family response regulator